MIFPSWSAHLARNLMPFHNLIIDWTKLIILLQLLVDLLGSQVVPGDRPQILGLLISHFLL